MRFEIAKKSLPSRQTLAIGLVVLLGLLAGAYLLRSPTAGSADQAHTEHAGHDDEGEAHQDENAGSKKGPHGGRWFTAGEQAFELTIFEQGVPPQFRLYSYRDGKPANPDQTRATLTLTRLGRPPQVVNFSRENDYLKGDAVVTEPHSFSVTLTAQNGGKSYAFEFEQVEARVTMDDAQLKSNGVTLATAGPARIKNTLQLIGEVRLNEDKTVRIVPRLNGIVESVSANAGDRVRKGQILAVLSSLSLADQRSELLAAQKRLALARTTMEREKKLWEEKISAQQDYLQALQVLQEAEIAEQSARQKLASLGTALPSSGDLTRYEIRSPIDGVITDKQIAVGEVLKEDKTIFVVADMSTVWIDATVYAKDLNLVRSGQRATVKATAFEAQASASIRYVGAVVGDQTRTALARLVLPNPQGLWRPGLPVDVYLVTSEVEVPLAVAADAIQTVRDWSVVFGRYGNQFEARPLTLGRSDGSMVEVLDGLVAGERYALRNSYLIKADLGKSGASHDH